VTRELNDEARSLIRAALSDEHGPGPAHRARLRQKVLARAAAGAIATVVGGGAAQAGAHSLSAIVASSVGVGLGVGLLLAGAAQLAFPTASSRSPEPSARSTNMPVLDRREQVPRRAPVVEEARAPTAEVPETSPGESTAGEKSAAPAPLKRNAEAIAPSSSTSGTARGSPLRAELDSMARVQEALRDSQGTRALALIASYDALYPNGVLKSERLAAEVFAACQLGDRTRARAAAERFLATDRSSSLAVRVRNSCANPQR
jgi:hypothetical protein